MKNRQEKKKRCLALKRWRKAKQKAQMERIAYRKALDAPPTPSDENEEYEKTMSAAEKVEREVYIKDMWKSHQQACTNSGFMTQTTAQFRENMRGFWRLNHASRPWKGK